MMLLITVATGILACVATCWLMYEAVQRNRVSSFERHRIMLHRVTLSTRTTKNKGILFCCIANDVLSLLTCLLGLPAFVEAMHDYCELVYETFLLMLFLYQIFAVVRLVIFICHFIYGQRFWRWVKRRSCCSCLSAVEYE